jgi:hypothetical protein
VEAEGLVSEVSSRLRVPKIRNTERPYLSLGCAYCGVRGESGFLTGLSTPGTLVGCLTAERPARRVAFAATPWSRN